MKLVLFAGAILLVLAALSIGPLMSQVEQPSYTIDRQAGPIELRTYPPTVMAETHVKGDRQAAIREGFQILAGYIFGANQDKRKIAMTAPVMQRPDGTAAKQISELAPGVWSVQFVMPRAFDLKALPKPNDARVALVEHPASKVAVLRFSGWARDATIKEKMTELEAFVASAGLKTAGAPSFAFYNPPWTLPMFRRNEIMIPLAPS